MTKLCKQCNLELYGMEREGDICLRCLQSIRPHTTYHEHTYSTIEGMIRQSTDNPLNKTKMNEYTYTIPVELQDKVLGEIEITVSAETRSDADKKVQKLCDDQIRANFENEIVHCEQE